MRIEIHPPTKIEATWKQSDGLLGEVSPRRYKGAAQATVAYLVSFDDQGVEQETLVVKVNQSGKLTTSRLEPETPDAPSSPDASNP